MRNFIMNVPQTLILFKIATVILAMQKYLEGVVINGPKYFCKAKIAEAILNKIKVCGTFIIKFCIEIHLLKDDSIYHENKLHSKGNTNDLKKLVGLLQFLFKISFCVHLQP